MNFWTSLLAAVVAIIKRDLRQSFLHCFHFIRSYLNITVIHKGKHKGCAALLFLYILQNAKMMLFYKMLKSLFIAFWNTRETRFCSALIRWNGSAEPLSIFFSHNCCCLAFEAYWIYFCYACYKLEDSILYSVLSITPAQLCEFCLKKCKDIICRQFVVAVHLFMHSHLHRKH